MEREEEMRGLVEVEVEGEDMTRAAHIEWWATSMGD